MVSSSEKQIRIERLRTVNNVALALVQEYYEAIGVLKRDSSQSIEKLADEPGSGMWLAYLRDAAVGCVVLRSLPTIPSAAECKRLYVRPAARGHGIADRLMDALEEFAASQGLQWIYLDSFDDLKSAIALYEKRGYHRCERYNDNPQATLFMRKRLA
jgi:GNAT superfamily N-acetyltransferase